MIGNIIVFTDYFIHSMMDIVENISLTVGLYFVSSHKECIDLVKNTPNLLGVYLVDWKPNKHIYEFYKELLHVCDVIAMHRDTPLTVCVHYKLSKTLTVIQSIKTSCIYIYTYKLTHLTDEIIKLDGLAPIISESQGLFHATASYAISPSRVEFDSEYFNTVVFALLDDLYEIPFDMMERHPILRSIHAFRNKDLSYDDLTQLLAHTPFSHMLK